MTNEKIRILLANTLDREGGAEQVAWSLLQGMRARGHDAWLAVGVKKSNDRHVALIDNTKTRSRNPWSRFWWSMQRISTALHGKYGRWGEKVRRGLGLLAEPQGVWETLQGYENSHFPGTYSLLDLPPRRPDILHCHSLQRGYFELEALPSLSHQVPTIVSLHDAWLLSGHCTHSFDCERWRTGCGQCPDLTIPPALLRDGTARNWQRKRDIFMQSRLWVSTDSEWMMKKVRASMLTYVDSRVIYPGIDLEIFRPSDRPGGQQKARAELGLPQAAKILLFVAHKARTNPWKDYSLLEQMYKRLTGIVDEEIILLVAGDPVSSKIVAEEGVWLAPPIDTYHELAKYYRAADIYVHAAHYEGFGLTLVEAMASSIPVVATRTAAVPEVVTDEESGFLTSPGDVEEMTARVVDLLSSAERRQAMGRRAEQASKQFDVNRTINAYLDWYGEILAQVEMPS